MAEPEMAYVQLDENMVWAENLVTYIVEKVLENAKFELDILGRDLNRLEAIKPPFLR